MTERQELIRAIGALSTLIVGYMIGANIILVGFIAWMIIKH